MGFVVEAKQDIKQGEQIFMSYKHHQGNQKMFINYGFIIDSPTSEEVLISLTLYPLDELLSQK